MESISIFLIDPNPGFLQITTRLLQDYYHGELTVVGSSSGRDHLIDQVQQQQPQIILLGLNQQSLASLRLIPRLRAILPRVGIIALGTLDFAVYEHAAQQAGADAFIAKAALNSALLPTIRHVVQSRTAAPSAGETARHNRPPLGDCAHE